MLKWLDRRLPAHCLAPLFLVVSACQTSVPSTVSIAPSPNLPVAHASALAVGVVCPTWGMAISTVRYPAEAWRNREQGMVVVEFTVATSGEAADLRIVEHATPLLDEAALGVVHQLRCSTNGRVKVLAPFQFKLK